MTAERILTRDVSSGRVHARYRINGALLSDERDNQDDAGDFVELADLEGVPPADLCRRCFGDEPPPVDDGAVE